MCYVSSGTYSVHKCAHIFWRMPVYASLMVALCTHNLNTETLKLRDGGLAP